MFRLGQDRCVYVWLVHFKSGKIILGQVRTG
jgi:hypothetical protein